MPVNIAANVKATLPSVSIFDGQSRKADDDWQTDCGHDGDAILSISGQEANKTAESPHRPKFSLGVAFDAETG
jgi:hypothetical protein